MSQPIFQSFNKFRFPGGENGCIGSDFFKESSKDPKIHHVGPNIENWFGGFILEQAKEPMMIVKAKLARKVKPVEVFDSFADKDRFIPALVLRYMLASNNPSILNTGNATVIFKRRPSDGEIVLIALCYEVGKGFSFRGYEMKHKQVGGNIREWFPGVEFLFRG